MERTGTISGTYGSGRTPCTVYTYGSPFGTWYAVEGSSNVNHTTEELSDGVNVEEVSDDDAFTWPDGIYSEEDLESAVNA